jgi:hypothetical protein
MTRRGDPEPIFEARRVGVFIPLVSARRLDQLDAEHCETRWGTRGGGDGARAGIARLLARELALHPGRADWYAEARDGQ